MIYWLTARRYSKNGNKTYSYNGFITKEELDKFIKIYQNTKDRVWYIHIDIYSEKALELDIDL